MTAPQSWALALPGAFPNVRGIVIDILGAGVMLDGRLLGPGHFAPASYPEAPLPFTEVYRNPSSAGVNPQGWEDIQELQLGMWVGSHRETYELVEEVRRVLRPFHHGGAHKGIWIDTIHEAGSPGAPSEEDEDRHEMVWPWLVVTRQHRGLAIYP